VAVHEEPVVVRLLPRPPGEPCGGDDPSGSLTVGMVQRGKVRDAFLADLREAT
jgi:hypothetical protein